MPRVGQVLPAGNIGLYVAGRRTIRLGASAGMKRRPTRAGLASWCLRSITGAAQQTSAERRRSASQQLQRQVAAPRRRFSGMTCAGTTDMGGNVKDGASMPPARTATSSAARGTNRNTCSTAGRAAAVSRATFRMDSAASRWKARRSFRVVTAAIETTSRDPRQGETGQRAGLPGLAQPVVFLR